MFSLKFGVNQSKIGITILLFNDVLSKFLYLAILFSLNVKLDSPIMVTYHTIFDIVALCFM